MLTATKSTETTEGQNIGASVAVAVDDGAIDNDEPDDYDAAGANTSPAINRKICEKTEGEN